MKYIKKLSEYLIFERFEPKGRRMFDLVMYFDKSIHEKEKILPSFFDTHYPEVFNEWCMNNVDYFLEIEEYDSEEEARENVEPPLSYHELHYYGGAEEKYQEFLVDIVDNISFDNNPHDLELHILPLYITYSYEGDVEDEWLVHFTGEKDTQEQILKDQYFHGIPNMHNLAITAGNEDDWVKDGYCFAYDLQNMYYNFREGTGYGEYGILFKGTGVHLYHNGDDEIQTIFIGDQVSNMMPFYYDRETKELYNKDNTIRTPEFDDFFEEMIK